MSAKLWKTPEDLKVEIEAYFDKCDINQVHETKEGKPIYEPYTVEGLALALNCTHQTLLNYERAEGYEPYFEAIKMAKLRIQQQKVINGMTGKSNPTITIFDLKNNHGYKDKQEVESTVKDITPPKIQFTDNDKDTEEV